MSDQDRRELYPPVGPTDVARQADLVAIRGEIAELRGELKAQSPRLHVANSPR